MNCHVLLLEDGKKELHLLSPFSKEELQNVASKSELFIGQLVDPEIGVIPGNIAYNKDFLVHLHLLVRDCMVNDPEVIRLASEQPNGFVFIVDGRSPHTTGRSDSMIDKEDIIGVFLCNDRKTDVNKYRPGPDYLVISEKGVTKLPESVEKHLKEMIS